MTKDYWNTNIEEWGKFYLGISHSNERLKGPKLFTSLYKLTIGRHEARLMRRRYSITLKFIDRYVNPGHQVIDLGCGTGIFTVALLKKGATVIAADYASRALESTRLLVSREVPEFANRVSYVALDISQQEIPRCDGCLCVGVTPYLDSLDLFFANVGPKISYALVSFLDNSHWANRLRSKASWLNVRNLHAFSSEEIDKEWSKNNLILDNRYVLGTGFLDTVTLGVS